MQISNRRSLKPNEQIVFKAVFDAPKLSETDAITFRVALEFYNLLEGFQGNKVPVLLNESNQ